MQGFTHTAAEKSALILRCVKCKSKAMGYDACLKSMSSTITMQGSTLTGITVAKEHTLIIVDVKFNGERNIGRGH